MLRLKFIIIFYSKYITYQNMMKIIFPITCISSPTKMWLVSNPLHSPIFITETKQVQISRVKKAGNATVELEIRLNFDLALTHDVKSIVTCVLQTQELKKRKRKRCTVLSKFVFLITAHAFWQHNLSKQIPMLYRKTTHCKNNMWGLNPADNTIPVCISDRYLRQTQHEGVLCSQQKTLKLLNLLVLG